MGKGFRCCLCAYVCAQQVQTAKAVRLKRCQADLFRDYASSATISHLNNKYYGWALKLCVPLRDCSCISIRHSVELCRFVFHFLSLYVPGICTYTVYLLCAAVAVSVCTVSPLVYLLKLAHACLAIQMNSPNFAFDMSLSIKFRINRRVHVSNLEADRLKTTHTIYSIFERNFRYGLFRRRLHCARLLAFPPPKNHFCSRRLL